MTQRLPSDHPSVDSFDATVRRRGRTDRLAVVVPHRDGLQLPTDELLRLTLEESTYRMQPRETTAGVRLPGAYDSPALARNPEDGVNRLTEWIEDVGLGPSRTVTLDVIDAGVSYGLRAPGERTVYTAFEEPDSSLAAIASQLE